MKVTGDHKGFAAYMKEENSMEELFDWTGYVRREMYADSRLNTLLDYWVFLDEKEKEIQEITGVSLETVLYGKFYWCTQFNQRLHMLGVKDAGMDQQHDQLIDELEHRITAVDWELVEKIYKYEYADVLTEYPWGQ